MTTRDIPVVSSHTLCPVSNGEVEGEPVVDARGVRSFILLPEQPPPYEAWKEVSIADAGKVIRLWVSLQYYHDIKSIFVRGTSFARFRACIDGRRSLIAFKLLFGLRWPAGD